MVCISSASVGAPSRAATQPTTVTRREGIGSAHRRAPRGVVGDRQFLDAVQPRRSQPARRPEQLHIQPGVGDRVEHDPRFEAGEVGADAVVLSPAAERDVRVRAAADVELARFGEDGVVEVGGGEVQTYAFAPRIG